MMGRVRWSHVTIALALIAALAIAAPAIGGPSLKKLVKKEVAKQIAKATGPQGPQGPQGPPGANGADGTARAFARVEIDVCTGGAGGNECVLQLSKGVTRVTRVATGRYCVSAPGTSSADVAAAVTVDHGLTVPPEGNASAMIRIAGVTCAAGEFQVVTERRGATTDPVEANDVGFTIVIP